MKLRWSLKKLSAIGAGALCVFVLNNLFGSSNLLLLNVFNRENYYVKSKTGTFNQRLYFTVLDWSPTRISEQNGLPMNANFDNCLVTRNRTLLNISDTVVVDVRKIPYLKNMPQVRYPWQRWIYLNTESPYNAILGNRGHYKMSDFKGKYAFNWTMTYRTDADVPMLHGWTVKKSKIETQETNIDSIVRNKTKLAAALISNCRFVKNGRGRYIKELQKYMAVDVFGKCGTLNCSGRYIKKCDKVKDYKFFLAFENSNCRDYITWKMWMQAFGNNAVPVVMGAYKEDYTQHVQAPPNSFIHVDDFDSPKELAEYLKTLHKNETAYRAYHKWREIYRIDYDFRFMGSFAWSSLCSKLNSRYNEAPRWHKTITDFENPVKDCYLNKWVKKKCNNNPYDCL